MQRCGVEEVAAALDAEEVTLLLVLRDSEDDEVTRLRSLATARGIPVREGSRSDLWRMARRTESEEPPGVLALVGRDPGASVERVLSTGGLVWLLAGAR
ncbi:MAG: RNA methyltransferase substrate-binding domain-containing protein, partial [Candidatus Thalassarchaeaceae archaeon]|nr:RNA methyltransferase substrate-binding domain-containing protein [Candidatus Thalassarchaeaceae archaeon]